MLHVARVALLSSGERFPVLLYASTQQPVVLPTRYVIDRRRETKQSSTIERDVRVLGWLYDWSHNVGIDLERLLREGKMLDVGQITGFCRYLRAIRRENVDGSIGIEAGRVDILLPTTFNAYIGVAEGFLVWGAEQYLPRGDGGSGKNIRADILSAKERLWRIFSNQRIGGKTAERLGLADEEVAELRQVIAPGSPRNPFKRPGRLRNHLIIELMLLTGIRRGELLKLKLAHLPQGPKSTLTIRRSPDDKEDPRRREPQVKTLEREIPLPKWLAVRLWEYVSKHRIKGAHGYVFTSQRGKLPLDYGGVNWIFSLLVDKRFPRLKGLLHPHALRHTFNNRLARHSKELGWSEDQLTKVQKYLNGWTEQSTMPERYTRRLIQSLAMELAESYQKSLYTEADDTLA
jgi:integrase